MTLYHVCPKWDGRKLESLYDQYGDEAYNMYAEKWPEAGELAEYHANQIHFFNNLEDAKEFQEDFDGEILVINDPNNELSITIDTLEFAHPVSKYPIDASYISKYYK